MNTIAQKYSAEKVIYRALQLFLVSFGFSFFFYAFSNFRFRDAEGFLSGKFCLPLAVGTALIILGWAVVGRFKKFAGWFVLAFVGQAVALQMINAGPSIHYQHYKSLDHFLTGTHPLFLIFIGVQTVLVVASIKTRWSKIRTWIGHTFKVWQLLAVGLIFILSSAAMSRDIQFYIAEIFFASFIQAINLGNILLMVWVLPGEALASLKEKFDKWLGQPGVDDRESIICNQLSETRNPKKEPGGVDRFAILAAIWVVILATVLNFLSYERHPHVPDEAIYLYHARYLAEGSLTVPAPPVQEAFSIYMIPYGSERWYSIFPPGWPAVLAIGIAFGVPWLVNPFLAGLNILLTYVLIQEIYSRRTARMAVLLLCFSPWYIFMALNFMAHTFTLTCALAAAVAICRARRTGKTIWAWLGGMATGMVSLIRPLDGLIVAGLLGLWAMGIRGWRLMAYSLGAFIFGTILVGAVALPYNKHITGEPTMSPLTAYYARYYGPKVNALGFGPERGLGWAIEPFPGHSPLKALLNAILNMFSVNIELFGWSTGSLIIIALLVFSGAMHNRDYLMLAVIVATFGAYSLYWFSGGPDFGARYWYLMLIPLICLAVRGVQFLEERFQSDSVVLNRAGTRVIVAVLFLCIFTFANYIPWRAVDKYHNYRGMRPDIPYLEKKWGFGRSLVLVRGNLDDYTSAWVYNPLDPFADAPLYAWDQNPGVRARVLSAYPDRPVWILEGPSVTHAAFKVVKGPVSASEVKNEAGGNPLYHGGTE